MTKKIPLRVSLATADFSIYVLGPDLAARGIEEAQVIDRVSVVDYRGFVDLVAEKGTVQSWL